MQLYVLSDKVHLGKFFHIATNESIKICNVVELICDLMNVQFKDNVEVAGEQLGKDSAYLLDSSKARNTLGWKDQVSLKKGIFTVLEWIEKNFDLLKKQPLDYIHKA